MPTTKETETENQAKAAQTNIKKKHSREREKIKFIKTKVLLKTEYDCSDATQNFSV